MTGTGSELRRIGAAKQRVALKRLLAAVRPQNAHGEIGAARIELPCNLFSEAGVSEVQSVLAR